MSETNDRSRVLTLVFTDLVDSTALKTERGDQAVDALITRHQEHVVWLAQKARAVPSIGREMAVF